jgi:hypothetical protein
MMVLKSSAAEWPILFPFNLLAGLFELAILYNIYYLIYKDHLSKPKKKEYVTLIAKKSPTN